MAIVPLVTLIIFSFLLSLLNILVADKRESLYASIGYLLGGFAMMALFALLHYASEL